MNEQGRRKKSRTEKKKKRNRGVRRHSLVSQRRPQRRKQVTQGAPPSPLTTELTDEEEKAEDAGDGDWKGQKLKPRRKKPGKRGGRNRTKGGKAHWTGEREKQTKQGGRRSRT